MDENNHSNLTIKEIAEPISYFLAGSFIIVTVLSSSINGSNLLPSQWFSVIIGIILMAVGLVFALVLLPFKSIVRIRISIESKLLKYVYPLVFAVTTTRVVQSAFSINNFPIFSIVTFVFLVIVLFLVVLSGWKALSDIRSLLTISVILNIMAIIITLTNGQKIELVTALVPNFINT